MADEKRSRTRNGIMRSLLLPKPVDERLTKLCEATDLNRNALVKLVAMVATPKDIREFQRRAGD